MITSGKTGSMSATGFMGIVSGLMSLTLILALIVYFFCQPSNATVVLELVDKVIVIFSISAGLLGVRKISGVIGNSKFSAGSESSDVTVQQNNRNSGGGGRYYNSADCNANED